MTRRSSKPQKVALTHGEHAAPVGHVHALPSGCRLLAPVVFADRAPVLPYWTPATDLPWDLEEVPRQLSNESDADHLRRINGQPTLVRRS